MFTVIIADDEEIECRGQEKILLDSFNNIRLLPSASNGEELIRAVRQEKPDIIITDINMPGLGGLKAVEVLRKEAVNSRVIINTAYSEFEYAREAIALGASDFLVKPLERETYLKAVEKAMKSLEKERSLEYRANSGSREYQKVVDMAGREVLSSVILGKPNEEELQIWLENIGHTYWGGVFAACSLKDPSGLEELSKAADKILKPSCTFLSKIHNEMLILFLFPGEQVGKRNYQEWISGLLCRFSREAEEHLRQIPRLGVGRWRYDYEEMDKSYREAVAALEGGTKEKICFFEKKVENPVFRNWQDAKELWEQLVDAVKCREMGKIQEFLCRQIRMWGPPEYKRQQMTVMLVEELQNCSRKICGHNIYSWQQLRQAFSELESPDELAEKGTDFLRILIKLEEKKDARSGYVLDALEYIENNFTKDITLEEAASAAGQGISSFYLSRLLSQQLQTSFVELLAAARINKAISLMRKQLPEERNISSQVGYQSAAYFYRVFKKNTGMTVGEMREFLTER